MEILTPTYRTPLNWFAIVIASTVSILLAFSTPSWAQDDYRPGYIIAHQGDTTYGFIEYGNPKSNASFCLFKSAIEDDKPHKFGPEDLVSYRFIDSKYYQAKTLLFGDYVGKYFLEYLLDGVIEIYYLAHPFKDYFFIEKNGTLLELSDEKKVVRNSDGKLVAQYVTPYTGVLQYIMKDALELSEQINKTSFNHRSIIDIGKRYHDLTCKTGDPCLIYYKDEKKLYDIKWKFRVGLYVGLAQTKRQTRSSVSTGDKYYIEAKNDQEKIVLVSTQMVDRAKSARAIIEKSYLYPTLALNLSNKWRTSGQLDVQYHSYDIDLQTLDQKVSTDFLKILLSLNYEFIDRAKIRPYVRAGASFNKYYYRVDGDVGTPHIFGDLTTYYSTIHSNSHLNFLAGIGVLLGMGNGPQVKAEVLYDANFLTNNKPGNDPYNHTNSFLVQLGIFF